jgi:hypothetical protein
MHMRMDKFVARTVAKYLRNYRPLTGWEQLGIIKHCSLSYKEKLQAYRQLLAEFPADQDLAGDLRRRIGAIAGWLDRPPQKDKAKAGVIFRATIEWSALEPQEDESNLPKERHRHRHGHYSPTYRRAKRWLDSFRRKMLRERQENGRKLIILENRIIEIPSDRLKGRWNFFDFDRRGKLENDCAHPDLDLPDRRYFNFGEVFRRGDIVRDRHRGYSVIYGPCRDAPPDFLDWADVRGKVLEWRGRLMVFGVDYTSLELVPLAQLPDDQKILAAISRHLQGIELLPEAERNRIDPDGSLLPDCGEDTLGGNTEEMTPTRYSEKRSGDAPARGC